MREGGGDASALEDVAERGEDGARVADARLAAAARLQTLMSDSISNENRTAREAAATGGVDIVTLWWRK